jgi:hypothetical protein
MRCACTHKLEVRRVPNLLGLEKPRSAMQSGESKKEPDSRRSTSYARRWILAAIGAGSPDLGFAYSDYVYSVHLIPPVT